MEEDLKKVKFVYQCIHCNRYTYMHTEMQRGDWELCVKKDRTKQVGQLLKNQGNLTLTLKFCLQHLYLEVSSELITLNFFAVDFETFRLKFVLRCYVWQGRDIIPDKGVNRTWQISA